MGVTMTTEPQKRRDFTPEQKVAILRQHLLDHVAVSDLCDQQGLRPNQFHDWQKLFFENGAAACNAHPVTCQLLRQLRRPA